MDSMIILRTDTKIEGNLTASTGTFGNEKSVISVTGEDIKFKTPVFGVSTEYSFIDLLKKLDDIDAKTGAMVPSDDITNDYNTEGLLPSLPIPDGDYTIALTDGFAVYELTGSSLSIAEGEPTTRYTFEGDELDTLIEQMQQQSSGAGTQSIENGTENHTALVIPTIIGIDPILKRVYFKIVFVGDASDDTICDAGDYIYRWKPLESELHVSLGKVDLTGQPSVSMPVPASDALLINYEADTSGASTIASIERLSTVDAYEDGFHVSYAGMFKDRSELTQINLSQWSFANVSDMSEMFMGCYGLVAEDDTPLIDMRRAANPLTDKLPTITDIFTGCTEGLKIYLPNSSNWVMIFGGGSERLDTNVYMHPNGYAVEDHEKRPKWLSNDGSTYILFGTTGSPISDGVLSYGLMTYHGRYYGANTASTYSHSTGDVNGIDYRLEDVKPADLPDCFFKGNNCTGNHTVTPATT